MRRLEGETSAMVADSPVEGVRVQILLRTSCRTRLHCLADSRNCNVAHVVVVFAHVVVVFALVVV